MYCDICLWNQSQIVFDDQDYHEPVCGTIYYTYYKSNGYNLIINPNRYNKISVCSDCLINNIYDCNVELKEIVLKELIEYVACRKIQKWWLNILYNIDFKVGKIFIQKNISDFTKTHLNVNL